MDIFLYDINIKVTKFHVSSQSFLSQREREIETILSFGNGYIGMRNALEEFYPQSNPGCFIAGFYEKNINDSETEVNLLIKIPDWTRIKIFVNEELLNLIDAKPLYHNRYIDFNSGCIVREWRCEDETGRVTSIKIVKYISFHNKHEMGKSILVKPENYTGNLRILSGLDCDTAGFDYLINQNINIKNHAAVYMKSKFSNKEFMMLQKSEFMLINNEYEVNFDYRNINNFSGSYEEWEWLAEMGKSYEVMSVVCLYDNIEADSPQKSTERHFLEIGKDFFSSSFENHTKKWARRWKESCVKIAGNKCDQKYLDFSVYHLLTSGEFSGNKNSIPARKLSGESYKGHVFWDTEMYLLPFFIYTKPEIARNLLMYRYNTLNGARRNAINEGFKGASYAWESTDTGLEDTPSYTILPNGKVVYILSGRYENHISADVAYTVWKYYEATNDNNFLVNFGAEILFETARFYESLIRLENDDLYHIPSVIGPDEYHEKVDDNAYTNYLAKYNFEIAVRAYEILEKKYKEELLRLKIKIRLDDSEIDKWKNYKDKIYLGYDERTKLFEQFKGFYNLEYIDLKQFEPRTVPLDLILGRENIEKYQVVKQADVLMLLFLFGEKFSQEQIAANYEFYEPKCGHGSSLSPSIHSIIAARIGKAKDAYKYFCENACIDLDNRFSNAAGGIHAASIGGTWMAAVMGFAGMQASEKGLMFSPNLPELWKKLIFSVKWRGLVLKIVLSNEKISFCVLSENGEKNIFVGLGKDNWKEFQKNKSYYAVKINGVWNWKD